MAHPTQLELLAVTDHQVTRWSREPSGWSKSIVGDRCRRVAALSGTPEYFATLCPTAAIDFEWDMPPFDSVLTLYRWDDGTPAREVSLTVENGFAAQMMALSPRSPLALLWGGEDGELFCFNWMDESILDTYSILPPRCLEVDPTGAWLIHNGCGTEGELELVALDARGGFGQIINLDEGLPFESLGMSDEFFVSAGFNSEGTAVAVVLIGYAYEEPRIGPSMFPALLAVFDIKDKRYRWGVELSVMEDEFPPCGDLCFWNARNELLVAVPGQIRRFNALTGREGTALPLQPPNWMPPFAVTEPGGLHLLTPKGELYDLSLR